MTLRTADERATSTGARSTAHGHSHDHRRSLPAPGLFARLPVEVALQVAISGVLAPHDLRQLSQSCRDWHALVADEYVWHALAVRTLGLESFHTPLLQAAAHAGVEAAPAPASWHDLVKCMEQLERPYGWTVVGDPCPAASSADARSHMPGPAPLAATIPSVRLLSSTIAWDRTWLAVPEQRGVLVPNAPRSAAQLPTVHLIDTHTEYPMWSYTPTSPGNGTVTALSAVRHGEWLIMQWSWRSLTRTQEQLWASVHKSRFCTGSPGPENEGADAGTDGLHVGFTWIRDVVLASPSVPLHVPPVQLHYPHLLFLDTTRHVLTGHNIETGQLDMEVAWDHLLAPASPTWDPRDACSRLTSTYQFALAGPHLFIMPGHRDLVALDTATGEPVWSFSDMLAEVGSETSQDAAAVSTVPVSAWDLTVERPGAQPVLVPLSQPEHAHKHQDSAPEQDTRGSSRSHHLVSFHVDAASETLLLETVGGTHGEPHLWLVRHYLQVLAGRGRPAPDRPASGSAWAACIRLVPNHGVTLNLDDQWRAAHGRAWIPLLLPRWIYKPTPSAAFAAATTNTGPAPSPSPSSLSYAYARRDDQKPLSSHLGFEKGYLCPLILDWKHARDPAQLRVTCLPTGPPSLLAGLALTMYQVRLLPYSPFHASLLLTTFDTPPVRKRPNAAHIGAYGTDQWDEWNEPPPLPEQRNLLIDFNWGPDHHNRCCDAAVPACPDCGSGTLPAPDLMARPTSVALPA